MPLLILTKLSGKVAAATLLPKMLSPPTRNLNPNSKILSSMAAVADKTLNPNPSRLQNPRPLPQINAQHLQASAPRSLNGGGVRGVWSRSSAIDVSREARGEMEGSDSTLVVVSFYRFADFPDHAEMRKPLKELCEQEVKV